MEITPSQALNSTLTSKLLKYAMQPTKNCSTVTSTVRADTRTDLVYLKPVKRCEVFRTFFVTAFLGPLSSDTPHATPGRCDRSPSPPAPQIGIRPIYRIFSLNERF